MAADATCQGLNLECHHAGECPQGAYCQRNGAGETVCTFQVDIANARTVCTADEHCPADVCMGGAGKPTCKKDPEPVGSSSVAWSARTCTCQS